MDDTDNIKYIDQQFKDVDPWYEDELVAISIRSHVGRTKWMNIPYAKYEAIRLMLTEEK